MATHLVTGAGSGIGAALAARLRDRGDQLVLLVRSPEREEQLARTFPHATFVVADLAQPHTLEHAFDAAALPEQIDSVVHSAGIVDLGAVAELPLAAWQSQLTVNVVAPAELTRLVLPRVRNARGHIVFINSGAGLRTSPHWSAYAASKHALKALADGVRAEEESHGVRVTSVYPGRTATAMQQRVHEFERATYEAHRFIDPESVASSVLAALDLPRDAQLVDVTVRPMPHQAVTA